MDNLPDAIQPTKPFPFPPESVLCKVSLVFVANTDDEFLAVKKQLRQVFAGLDNARVTFELTDAPRKPPVIGL